MSDSGNPFESPASNTEVVKPLVSQGTLNEIMLKHLSDASPWLRFMGIMGFIGAGLLALIGLASLFAIPFAAGVDMDIFDDAGIYLSYLFRSLGSFIFMYAMYFIGAGALVFFPALFTYRFGAKIKLYTQTSSEQELELAFRNNKSLWKFNGILTIIGLAVVPLFIIIAVVVIIAALAMS